jgi:cytochrome P450
MAVPNAEPKALTTSFLSSMPGVTISFIFLALATILYNVNRVTADRRFAAENGCKPPLNRFPHVPLLAGLDFIVGNIKAFRKNSFLRLLQGRHEAIGWTFTARALARRGVFTIDPENIKSVLSLRFKDYSLGDRTPIMGPLLGRGIFVSDGDQWAHSRALLRPHFVKDQIADLHLVNKHIQRFLALIPEGESVDLQPLFLRFTLDSATEFLFGESTKTLTGTDKDNLAFGDAFNYSLKDMALQFRMGPFRKLRRRDSSVEDAHRVCRAYVDRFVNQAVMYRQISADQQEKKSKQPSESESRPERNFFLADLARSTDDKEKIRDELLNILIAGRDTVASLLSSLFHILARRPDVWKKIRDEVKSLEGSLPTYEQLRDLKYSKNCINEGTTALS